MPVTREEIRQRIQKKLDAAAHISHSQGKPESEVILDAVVDEIVHLHEIIEEFQDQFKELEDHLFPRGVSQS
jgi:Mg2+ and Co2+ transporter CorA